jgi:hypothetical protein
VSRIGRDRSALTRSRTCLPPLATVIDRSSIDFASILKTVWPLSPTIGSSQPLRVRRGCSTRMCGSSGKRRPMSSIACWSDAASCRQHALPGSRANVGEPCCRTSFIVPPGPVPTYCCPTITSDLSRRVNRNANAPERPQIVTAGTRAYARFTRASSANPCRLPVGGASGRASATEDAATEKANTVATAIREIGGTRDESKHSSSSKEFECRDHSVRVRVSLNQAVQGRQDSNLQPPGLETGAENCSEQGKVSD